MRRKNRKSGETLVEVMISIVIFLMLVALLQGSVAFCTNAQRKSEQIRTNTSTAIKNLWEGKNTSTGEAGSATFTFKLGDSTAFTVDAKVKSETVDDGASDSVTFYTYESK